MNGKTEVGDSPYRVCEKHQEHMGMFGENLDSAVPDWYFLFPFPLSKSLNSFVLFCLFCFELNFVISKMKRELTTKDLPFQPLLF